jgi:hypothetical protein
MALVDLLDPELQLPSVGAERPQLRWWPVIVLREVG